MTAPYDPRLPRPDPFDPRRYALVQALCRADLVAIAALALDLMPVDDITRAETHASQLARLVHAARPYRQLVTTERGQPGPSPETPMRAMRCPCALCRLDSAHSGQCEASKGP